MSIGKRRIAGLGNRHQHGVAIVPGAGVKVKTHDRVAVVQVLLQNRMQGFVRPARSFSAVVKTVRVVVLAGLDNRHHRCPAFCANAIVEQGVGLFA
ncbi:hypothetical protein D3C75_864440 [compost metagenome]